MSFAFTFASQSSSLIICAVGRQSTAYGLEPSQSRRREALGWNAPVSQHHRHLLHSCLAPCTIDGWTPSDPAPTQAQPQQPGQKTNLDRRCNDKCVIRVNHKMLLSLDAAKGWGSNASVSQANTLASITGEATYSIPPDIIEVSYSSSDDESPLLDTLGVGPPTASPRLGSIRGRSPSTEVSCRI